MGFFSAFTLFGIDFFGFLQKKPQHTTVLSQISSLQSFNSLVTDAQDPKVATAEAEMVNMTRVITQKIGEREILSLGASMVKKEDIERIVSKAALPNTNFHQEVQVDMENLLDVPKTLIDVVSQH